MIDAILEGDSRVPRKQRHTAKRIFERLRDEYRVDSGKGQNRTLRPLSAFWPPVFAGEQDAGPPKG